MENITYFSIHHLRFKSCYLKSLLVEVLPYIIVINTTLEDFYPQEKQEKNDYILLLKYLLFKSEEL